MNKKNKKLRVNKETIKPLTNEHLQEVAGGVITGYSWVWQDTCAAGCTDYNCGYSYRNCTA